MPKNKKEFILYVKDVGSSLTQRHIWLVSGVVQLIALWSSDQTAGQKGYKARC